MFMNCQYHTRLNNLTQIVFSEAQRGHVVTLYSNDITRQNQRQKCYQIFPIHLRVDTPPS
jgi:hypothetical protein